MLGYWDACGRITLEDENGVHENGVEGYVYLEEIEINAYNK